MGTYNPVVRFVDSQFPLSARRWSVGVVAKSAVEGGMPAALRVPWLCQSHVLRVIGGGANHIKYRAKKRVTATLLPLGNDRCLRLTLQVSPQSGREFFRCWRSGLTGDRLGWLAKLPKRAKPVKPSRLSNSIADF